MQQKHVELTRHELYEQVWSKPVTHVAMDCGISDAGLAKICRKHNVPTPPLRYWSKVKDGKKGGNLCQPPQPGISRRL